MQCQVNAQDEIISETQVEIKLEINERYFYEEENSSIDVNGSITVTGNVEIKPVVSLKKYEITFG